MRIFVLFLFLSLCTSSFAQLAKEGGTYKFHKAIRQKSDKQEIYEHAMSWVQDHFVDNKCGSVKYRSQEQGKIIVEGAWDHTNGGAPEKINFTLLIEIRNGVYRETFSDFTYQGKGKAIPLESKKLAGKNKLISDVNTMIDDFSNDLINSMSRDAVATM